MQDIKPDNLLLASDGSVKIGDLGVARQFGAEEAALISETQGTFHFFSPEMCGGERYCPFKSDLWSLGVTLFILATGGVVPFMSADDNPQELFTAIADHRQGHLPYPPDVRVSEPLRELIDLILDPNPNTRLSIQQIRVRTNE
jgi:serine/threonine protein kinase